MSADGSLCERCGSALTRRLYANRDYISGEDFEIAACEECGLVRSIIPDASGRTDRYYDAAYYGEEGRRFPAFMEGWIRAFRGRRAALVRRLHPVAGRILDIGCGRGWMLAELKRCGWECTGTETNTELARATERQHGFRVYPMADLKGELLTREFDVITLWHVFEHLRAPIATLGHIRRMLRPGGLLILETPNLASVQSRLGRGRWFHLDAPRHRFHFSPPSLMQILEQHGFRIIRRSTFSLEYGFYGFFQTILNFVTRQPNHLYRRLQVKRQAEMQAPPMVWALDGVLTAAVLPVAIAAGTVLELAAAAARSGAVIQIAATRTSG